MNIKRCVLAGMIFLAPFRLLADDIISEETTIESSEKQQEIDDSLSTGTAMMVWGVIMFTSIALLAVYASEGAPETTSST